MEGGGDGSQTRPNIAQRQGAYQNSTWVYVVSNLLLAQFAASEGQRFAEVHYYALIPVHGELRGVAICSLYGLPHQGIYDLSSKTYITMQHHRDTDVVAIDARSILSVVLLAPDQRYPLFFQDETAKDRYYLVERPGLGILEKIGYIYTDSRDSEDEDDDEA